MKTLSIRIAVVLSFSLFVLGACETEEKKKEKSTDMFGYPHKSRLDQVEAAFGG